MIGTNWAQDAGIYEFTMGATGAKVKGRYTFVYVFEDGEWKISQHHSSVMPEGLKPQAITEEEVKDLFQLWNSALASEDADTVAKRYASKAVLLPTVSDIPRTDYALIMTTSLNSLRKSHKVKSWRAMSPLATTGARMLAYMSSLWVPQETRSRGGTPLFMSGRMVSGKLATTTPR